MLISLLNHSDRVTAACQAQLVNVIAPIRAEPGKPAWRQTIFYPFAETATKARGSTLRPAIDAPRLDTAEHGTVAAIDVAATVSGDSVAVFLVNRHPGHALGVEIRLQNLPRIGAARHAVLTDDDLTARNTCHDPNRVLLGRGTLTPASDRWLNVTLPPASWNMVTFSSAG